MEGGWGNAKWEGRNGAFYLHSPTSFLHPSSPYLFLRPIFLHPPSLFPSLPPRLSFLPAISSSYSPSSLLPLTSLPAPFHFLLHPFPFLIPSVKLSTPTKITMVWLGYEQWICGFKTLNKKNKKTIYINFFILSKTHFELWDPEMTTLSKSQNFFLFCDFLMLVCIPNPQIPIFNRWNPEILFHKMSIPDIQFWLGMNSRCQKFSSHKIPLFWGSHPQIPTSKMANPKIPKTTPPPPLLHPRRTVTTRFVVPCLGANTVISRSSAHGRQNWHSCFIRGWALQRTCL